MVMASSRSAKDLMLPRSSTGTPGAGDHTSEHCLRSRCAIWPTRTTSRVPPWRDVEDPRPNATGVSVGLEA